MNHLDSKVIEITMDYEIEGSMMEVFNFLANPENDALWQSSCDTVELMDKTKAVAEGSQYTIGFSFLSRRMHFQAEVTDYAFGERYGYRSLNGPMSYEGGYRFTERENSVFVEWFFRAVPGKFFGIIPQSLIKKTLTKKVGEDVERLQQTFRATQLAYEESA